MDIEHKNLSIDFKWKLNKYNEYGNILSTLRNKIAETKVKRSTSDAPV